jgi:hypothetical protein
MIQKGADKNFKIQFNFSNFEVICDCLPEEMCEDLEPLDLGLDEEESVAGAPHQVLRVTRRHGVGVRHQAHCTTTT